MRTVRTFSLFCSQSLETMKYIPISIEGKDYRLFYTHVDGQILTRLEMTSDESTPSETMPKGEVVEDVQEMQEEIKREVEPLRNHIFQDRIFDTNERLMNLRNTIASAIDMGEATIMYGKPQEVRINPNAQNEWYYIVKAIEEAGIAKNFAITHFIEQMMEWFPILFPSASQEEWEAFKRRLSKSISEEKGLWKHGKMKEVIPLCDMWAKQKSLAMDAAKMERIYAIAYKGLYQNLRDLKQHIAKEKSR